jgi:hypothetical protein
MVLAGHSTDEILAPPDSGENFPPIIVFLVGFSNCSDGTPAGGHAQ